MSEQHVLMKPIAKALGFKLGKIQYSHGGNITTDFGGEIFVRLEGYGLDGRGEASGNWPRNSKNEMHSPSDGKNDFRISFSLMKTPEKIAGDIQKRLLPSYKAAYLEQKAIADKWSERYAEKEARTKILCEAAGIGDRSDYGSQKVSGWINRDQVDQEHRIEIQVNSETVELSIESLSMEQALKIIKMLKVTK